MDSIKGRRFWQRVSNYSVLVCGFGMILNIVFKKYAVEYRFEVLIFGIIVISIYLLSQLMKLVLKKK
jgi:Na+/phosphate symporter